MPPATGSRRDGSGVVQDAGHQAGVHHQPLTGAVARVAGGQRQRRRPGLVDHRHVGRGDGQTPGHVVEEDPLQRHDGDRVARDQFVEVVEGVEIRGAMTGDRRIAALAGQRRPRVVAGTGLELCVTGTLHHHHRQVDLRNGDRAHRAPDGGVGDAAARLGDRRVAGWSAGQGRGGRGTGESLGSAEFRRGDGPGSGRSSIRFPTGGRG